MKIKLKVKLCTDGDFYIRAKELYEFEGCLVCDDDTDYIKYTFKGENTPEDWSENIWLKCEARSFLEIILTSIKVSYTHYNILSQLYELFDKAICALDDMEIGSVYKGTMSGNYEGTKIKISIVE